MFLLSLRGRFFVLSLRGGALFLLSLQGRVFSRSRCRGRAFLSAVVVGGARFLLLSLRVPGALASV